MILRREGGGVYPLDVVINWVGSGVREREAGQSRRPEPRDRGSDPLVRPCDDLAPGLWRNFFAIAATAPKSGSERPAFVRSNAMPETSYAACGDLSLAYQVFGDRPVELVFVGPMISHIELFWTLPEYKAFFDQLATFCRVLCRQGRGRAVDPVPQVRTLDDRAAEIEAVMDAVGFGKAAVFGMSEGGPQAIFFAAQRPERTRALILYGSYPGMTGLGLDDLDRDPAELRALALPDWGEATRPPRSSSPACRKWSAPPARRGAAVRSPSLCCRRSGRHASSPCRAHRRGPGMLRATLRSNIRIDVRPILPTITAPTLVIHARDEPLPLQCGRYLADHIPGARFLEVDGADHAPCLTEPDRILTGIEEFLTGGHAAPAPSHRALRTVLFTDMVASTQRAAATGDERWRAVLARFGEITAELTQRFGGTVVKSTGDGYLTTFDGPTRAIRCAEALRADAETLGIEIRAGIHSGECELLDADIGGIAVHIAARILGQAGAGEILVSRTVRDLVVGSGTGFEDRGSVELRGVPGTWQLLAVDRHGPRAGCRRGGTRVNAHPRP